MAPTGAPPAVSPAVVRWLLVPSLFVLGHWLLLTRRQSVLGAFPALWATGGKGVYEVLPPHPQTKSEAFELGWLAGEFASGGCGAKTSDRKCLDILRRAAEAVGSEGSLTAGQLQGARAFILELDSRRSLVDKVTGFFSFVNVIWLVSIVGLLVTVGPCLAYLMGPLLARVALGVAEALLPAARAMHRAGVFEAAGYALALAFSAQGCRYPSGQEDAAVMVALTGGLAFVPLWLYSSNLHLSSADGAKENFLFITYGLAFSVLAPLAVLHDSRLIGFIAVLALYGAMGFVFFAFGFGFAIGFDGNASTLRCLGASVLLVAGFASLRVLGVDVAVLRPFGTGAMVLGNICYFLALLILCSPWRRSRGRYKAWQATMVASLVGAMLMGLVFSMPSMSNTATTFMVLYIMEKQLEVNWGKAATLGVFANFVLLYFIAHYLHTHPEHVVSMFDPSGLYS